MEEQTITPKLDVDVLLVYPPVMLEYNPVDPPFGLMYIAAALREQNISVSILDLNALRWSDDQVKEFFEKNKFPVVGIGGMTTVYYYVKWLSFFIKEKAPETKIIGGGSFVTPCPRIVMEKTPIDVGCIGESEISVVPLVKKLLSGQELDQNLKGIVFKKDGKVIVTQPEKRVRDIGDLPIPAYDLVDIPLYVRNSGKRPALLKLLEKNGTPIEEVSNTFIMFASRGCPFECTFCYRNFGRVTKRSNIDALIDHIKYVNKIYGVNNIAFYDEIFNASKKWVKEFAAKAASELPGFYFWIGGARIDLIDDEVVAELKNANFYEVSVGVESFDDRILEEMDKKFGADTLLNGLKMLKEAELAPSCIAMLYGFPSDDEESLRLSENAIKELGIPAYFQFPLPFPGTFLYEEIKKQGKVGDEEEFMLDLADHMTQELFINLSKFPDEKLVKMVRDTEARINLALNPPPVEAEVETPAIPRKFPKKYVAGLITLGIVLKSIGLKVNRVILLTRATLKLRTRLLTAAYYANDSILAARATLKLRTRLLAAAHYLNELIFREKPL